MRRRVLLLLVLLAPLVALAGCVCCPPSADEAGLPARVDLSEPASPR